MHQYVPIILFYSICFKIDDKDTAYLREMLSWCPDYLSVLFENRLQTTTGLHAAKNARHKLLSAKWHVKYVIHIGKMFQTTHLCQIISKHYRRTLCNITQVHVLCMWWRPDERFRVNREYSCSDLT